MFANADEINEPNLIGGKTFCLRFYRLCGNSAPVDYVDCRTFDKTLHRYIF